MNITGLSARQFPLPLERNAGLANRAMAFAGLLEPPEAPGPSNLLPGTDRGSIAFDAGLFSQGVESGSLTPASTPGTFKTHGTVATGSGAEIDPAVPAAGGSPVANAPSGSASLSQSLSERARAPADAMGPPSGVDPKRPAITAGATTPGSSRILMSTSESGSGAEELVSPDLLAGSLGVAKLPSSEEAGATPDPIHDAMSEPDGGLGEQPQAEISLTLTETEAGPVIAYSAPQDEASWMQLKSIAEQLMSEYAVPVAHLSYKARVAPIGTTGGEEK